LPLLCESTLYKLGFRGEFQTVERHHQIKVQRKTPTPVPITLAFR